VPTLADLAGGRRWKANLGDLGSPIGSSVGAAARPPVGMAAPAVSRRRREWDPPTGIHRCHMATRHRTGDPSSRHPMVVGPHSLDRSARGRPRENSMYKCDRT